MDVIHYLSVLPIDMSNWRMFTHLIGPSLLLIFAMRGSMISLFCTFSPSLLFQLFLIHPSAHLVTTIHSGTKIGIVSLDTAEFSHRMLTKHEHLYGRIVVMARHNRTRHLLLTVYMLSVLISIGAISLPHTSNARSAA